MIIKPQLFPYLLFNLVRLIKKKTLAPKISVTLTDEMLQVHTGKITHSYALDTASLTVKKGWFYCSIHCASTDTIDSHTIHYLANDNATSFSDEFKTLQTKRQSILAQKKEDVRIHAERLQLFQDNEITVAQTLIDYHQSMQTNTYLTSYRQRQLKASINRLAPLLTVYDSLPELSERYVKGLQELQEIKRSFVKSFKQRNNKFEHKRQVSNAVYFDELEEHPLTPEQRNACTVDDNWNLVLASAGSGKTSVIVGKAGLLLKNQEVNETEILILSFASDAAKEINDRMRECLINNKKDSFQWARNIELQASTFHKLGCNIIRESRHALNKPVPKIFSKSEEASISDIKNQLIDMLNNDQEYAILIHYLTSHQKPSKTQLDFDSLTAMADYVRGNNLTTLNGEDVKSYEEYTIANYLYLNNIKYTYEKKYPGDTSMVGWTRDYHPDFTISDGDKTIYLEHYGVDEYLTPAPFFKDPEGYKQGIVDKQTIHNANNTTLIKTYSYQMREETLELNLKIQLLKYGFKLSDKPIKAVAERLSKHKALSELAQLLYSFLNQFKASQIDLDQLDNILQSRLTDKRRAAAFYPLFVRIYEKYEAYLKDHDKMDFNDMINTAIDYIQDGTYQSPYKRILVDEFQDISKARMSLVLALVKQDPENCRVFCVGDDFQAIFAFTGCDIAYIKYFREYFDKQAQFRPLFKTFRFNNKIGEVANHFIEKNDFQTKKKVITHQAPVEHPMIALVKTKEEGLLPISFSMQEIIRHEGLDQIEDGGIDNQVNQHHSNKPEKNKDKKISVLILTRYNKDKKKENKRLIQQTIQRYEKRYPNLSLSVMTCHKSKGQGEDYVIMLDLTKKGFPIEKVSDPLLSVLIQGDDTFQVENYPNAEERRLFYVGLTRAKKRVYLVVNPSNVSKFIVELLHDKCPIDELEDKTIYSEKNETPNLSICSEYCPDCKTGTFAFRDRSYVCQNKACAEKYPGCQRCKSGIVLRHPSTGIHTCSSCGDTFDACHTCDGWFWTLPNDTAKNRFTTCAYYHKNGCRTKPKKYYQQKKYQKNTTNQNETV